MTTEEKTLRLLASDPQFAMAGPDGKGNTLYGCITKEGKSSYVVAEDSMFSGFPGDMASVEATASWRKSIATRMGQLRGGLLWNCVGKLRTPEMEGDQRVQEFLWRAIHGSGEPVKFTIEEFQFAFKPVPEIPAEACPAAPEVASNPPA